MTDLTDLDALDALLAKATAGEWEHHGDVRGLIAVGHQVIVDCDGPNHKADAAAIVALRNAYPALARELRRLRKVETAAREDVARCRRCRGQGRVEHPMMVLAGNHSLIDPCPECGPLRAALAPEGGDA